MVWTESEAIRWTNRVAGLIAAAIGFAYQEPKALACFGVILTFELWLTQARTSALIKGIDARIVNALQYEYLPDSSLIWAKAIHFLENTQPSDVIISTASAPNAPDFENSIFYKVIRRRLTYKRLVCYVSPGDKVAPDNHGFSLFEPSDGLTTERLLEDYLEWYTKFHKAWETVVSNDRGEDVINFGMHTWRNALDRLRARHFGFEVRSHSANLPTDYFILNPQEGYHWKAVVGFPRREGERMGSGVAITHSLLAKDLGHNWQRLWEQAGNEVVARGRSPFPT